MARAAHRGGDRPLRGICLVVRGDSSDRDQGRGPSQSGSSQSGPSHTSRQSSGGRTPSVAAGTVAEFPRRPDAGVLSEAIPLFFIGRNRRGLWVAREAEGRTGGIFFFRESALRFAARASAPLGHAIMILAAGFELDLENRGNPLAAWLDKVLREAAGIIPAYPPPIPIERRGIKRIKGERR